MPMFSFTCPRCSLKSFSVEGSHCFRCDSNATTNRGLDDNFERRHQEISTSRDTDGARGSRNIQIQNRRQTSKVNVQNRKRNESNDRMTAEDIQAHEQCRNENSRINDHFVSHYCKKDRNNFDFMPEMCAQTIHKVSDNSNSKDKPHEFLNIEKPESYNQVKQGLCILDKTALMTVNKNTESIISILQCSRKQVTPGKISDFEVYSEENVQSMDDILAVQGPYDLRVNEHGSNLLGENLCSGGSCQVLSVQLGREKKLPCNVCNVEIHEHAKIRKGTYLYFCCVCKYTTRVEAYLQMHSDIHCPQKVCNVCSMEYRDGNLHDSEQACKVCKIKFDCKTLLDQHSVNHEEYFMEHCYVCVEKICDHFTKNNKRKLYVCCACNFRNHRICNFKKHSKIHRPKLFCMKCREEYPIKEKDLHGREWTCIMCGMGFKCKTLLEDHFVDHEDYFSSHCRICKQTIDEHYNKFEYKYKCCFCAKKGLNIQKLQSHLYSHTTLRLFKCDWCESRFYRSGDRVAHSQICIPLLYKCLICSARFPCSVSHDKHRVEKHGLTGEDAV